MNRHARRAAASKGTPQLNGLSQALASLEALTSDKSSLNTLQDVADKLRPMLEESTRLSAKLSQAYQALEASTQENVVLKQELELQRQIFLRMLANIGQLRLEDVLSMEQAIQEQLVSGVSGTLALIEPNEDKNPGNSASDDS
jgi:hypothetical protein